MCAEAWIEDDYEDTDLPLSAARTWLLDENDCPNNSLPLAGPEAITASASLFRRVGSGSNYEECGGKFEINGNQSQIYAFYQPLVGECNAFLNCYYTHAEHEWFVVGGGQWNTPVECAPI